MARGIYKVINVVSNKFYVGSAEDFVKRKRTHWWRLRAGHHHNKHLQASWDKYGEAAFVFAIVVEVPEDADLMALEREWLNEHYGKPYCYNAAADPVAFGKGKKGELNPSWGKRFSHTAEAKAKISAAGRNRGPVSEETREKRRKAMQGHMVTQETRAKLREYKGEQHHFYGQKRPEHGAKVSRAIEMIDDDGNVTQFPSIKALREATGLLAPTINNALKHGKPLRCGPWVWHSFRYL